MNDDEDDDFGSSGIILAALIFCGAAFFTILLGFIFLALKAMWLI